MTEMKISDSRHLSVDWFVTTTQAILAKKGSGKSYTASVEAEELLAAGQQIVVIDPTGAWYGLRSSSDGQSPGYPIAVFGGDHGDIALEATSGELVADAIVAEQFSVILDLSHFRKGEMSRFVCALLETLYRQNRKALHLFVDEADIFAPQKPMGDEARTLGAMHDVVRRGRIRGLGCTLITQRPQVIAKDVLSQIDMLTCLRMNHPRDLAAIREWVDVHADVTQAAAMIASLPSLPIGEAWLWAPASNLFERVKIRKRTTFDSGRTPRAGERVAEAKVLAPVDIARLGQAIAATHEQALARDPAALRKRISELEAKLLAAMPDNTGLLERVVEARMAVDQLGARLDAAIVAIGKGETGDASPLNIPASARATFKWQDSPPTDSPQTGRQARTRTPTSPAASATSAGSEPRSQGVTGRKDGPLGDIPRGERAVLSALLMYPRGLQRDQLTVLTGYKRSTRDAYIARLRERGLVETNLVLVIATPAARGAEVQPLPTGPALRDWWYERLGRGEAAILGMLCAAYPAGLTREQIRGRGGFARSTADAYLQRLSARELVGFSGQMVMASETLFEVRA